MFNNNSMNYYSTSTLKSALLKSYAWMAIALSITAIVSYGLYATNALLILLSTMPNVIKLRNDGFEENTKNVLLFFLWKI